MKEKLTAEKALEWFDAFEFTPKIYDYGNEWEHSTLKDEYGESLYYTTEDVESKVGPIRTAELFGGEGQGDHYEIVIKLIDYDLYFAGYGSWVSHDGVYWDDNEWVQVEPVEVINIEYLPINRPK